MVESPESSLLLEDTGNPLVKRPSTQSMFSAMASKARQLSPKRKAPPKKDSPANKLLPKKDLLSSSPKDPPKKLSVSPKEDPPKKLSVSPKEDPHKKLSVSPKEDTTPKRTVSPKRALPASPRGRKNGNGVGGGSSDRRATLELIDAGFAGDTPDKVRISGPKLTNDRAEDLKLSSITAPNDHSKSKDQKGVGKGGKGGKGSPRSRVSSPKVSSPSKSKKTPEVYEEGIKSASI
jgi:hypothetical protein